MTKSVIALMLAWSKRCWKWSNIRYEKRAAIRYRSRHRSRQGLICGICCIMYRESRGIWWSTAVMLASIRACRRFRELRSMEESKRLYSARSEDTTIRYFDIGIILSALRSNYNAFSSHLSIPSVIIKIAKLLEITKASMPIFSRWGPIIMMIFRKCLSCLLSIYREFIEAK